MNTRENIVNVEKDFKVNFTYTEEENMLIQSTSGDTMRLSLRQSDSTYNITASEILFLYIQSGIEHPSDIKNILILYCIGVKLSAKINNKSLR